MMLSHCNEYLFDIFAFDELTNHCPLQTMTNHLVVSSGLLKRMSINAKPFMSFVNAITARYDPKLRCIAD